MIKLLLEISPLKRFIFSSLALITILCLMAQHLSQSLAAKNLQDILHIFPEWQLTIALVIILMFPVLSFLFHYYILVRLKQSLKNSLEEKKIANHFEHLYAGKTFTEVKKNIETVLNLYKSFDTMKSARIQLEVSTIKILSSHLKEGIIFVNKDKVVTHINAEGESLLKLIPGEIINQSISRKIHSEALIKSLNTCLKEDTKTISAPLSQENTLNYSVIPIKDKQGDISRAIIIITHKEKDS